ncbi:MAG: sensor domain-containing diguanylate cyclase [Chloroflexi bacterium]|nr:sensor domain-containing diguanylate cyclase [Chloroflexota bacterium]
MEKNFLERATQDLNFHNNAHDGVIYTDSNNKIIYANPYFLEMMGIHDESEILNKPFPDYMWNDNTEGARLLGDIAGDGYVREREVSLHNREGKPVFAMCSGVASKSEEGEMLGTEIMFCNITGKRTVEAQLLEQHALLDAMLRSTPDPVLVLDADLQLQRFSPAAQRLLGLSEKLKDVPLMDLLASLGLDKETSKSLVANFSKPQKIEFEISLPTQHFDFHAAPMKSNSLGWVCVLHDVTERKRTEEQLQYYAYHDVLTSLPNRAFFIDRLERIISRARHEADYRFAILFIDVDNLKKINDSYGHLAGDQLLVEYARRLEACIRPEDVVCRLGGDEFAIFLDDIESESATDTVTARIQEALKPAFKLLDDHEVQSTASIGSAVSSENLTNIDELLNQADKAMYQAKEAAK